MIFRALQIIILFMFLACIWVSCDNPPLDDEVSPPTLSIQSTGIANPYIGTAGDLIDFQIEALIPGKFNGFSIVRQSQTQESKMVEISRITNPDLEGKEAFTYQFSYTITTADELIKLQFILTDMAGNDVTMDWQIQSR